MDQLITESDVRFILPTVPQIDTVNMDPDVCRDMLIIWGIRRQDDLAQFAKRADIFDFLASTYETICGTRLQAINACIWGALLFSRGLTDEVKAMIVEKVRKEKLRKYLQEEGYI